MADLKFRYSFAAILAVQLVSGCVASIQNLCDDPPRSCHCFSRRATKAVQLQCPTSENTAVKVKYAPDIQLDVECFDPQYDLNTFDLKTDMIRSVASFQMKNCRTNLSRSDEMFFVKFRDNTQLKKIAVTRSALKSDDVNVLYGHIRGAPIKMIALNGNELEEFPDMFANFPRLVSLELSDNLIKTLPERINFPSLKVLFLINNCIDALESGIFENATQLEYIDLSKNKITNLPARLLYPLPNLKVFILNSNSFRVVPDGFFERNTLLRSVWLSNGSLAEIGASIFSRFTQLEMLKLSHNLLRTLPQNIFANLSELTYLEIGNNLLEKLPENTFRGLRNLTHLYLFANKLTEWSTNYNRDLISLQTLQLNNNSLSKVDALTFSGLSQLKVLELRHNRISEVDERAFNDLKHLEELDLSSNDLKALDGTMDVLVQGTDRKMFVNLNNNRIFHIRAPDSFESVSSVNPRILTFARNSFACNCDNYEFIRFLQAGVKERKLRTSKKEECASPSHLKGIKLTDVNLNNITDCFEGCPVDCRCEIDPETNSLLLDCSDSNHTRCPSVPRLMRRTIEGAVAIVPDKVQVNLTGNRIEECKEDITYQNVTVLDLSNNKLLRVDWIPPSIEVLRLDNNLMTGLKNKMALLLNNSITLTVLTLHNNPWQCDCAIMELVNIINSKLIIMIPNVTITCSNGFPLLKLYQGKVCATHATFLIVSIAMLSLIVLVALILVILYFRYEDQVKIWIYNHKLLSVLIRADDLDRNMTYDAFVSYSHEDRSFVVERLVPQLENGSEGYRLCLHERDWILGEYISKQIANSVRDSRRTILVLSKNFLDSDWANFEFKLAHERSMSEKRTRLIMILYEDVDLSQIKNDELRSYLTTNTYIKWGDPWFWKKLKNAMPRRRIAVKENPSAQGRTIVKNIVDAKA